MSSKAMSLKGRINHYAKNNNIAAQVVMQNYMFERFLERLSKSEYQEKFVIKGGVLVAAIVGLNTRSTMDLDATLRNMPLTETQIRQAIQNICDMSLDDEVTFKVISIEQIRKDDIYGGFCVRLDAMYDTIVCWGRLDISLPQAFKVKIVCKNTQSGLSASLLSRCKLNPLYPHNQI